MTRSQSFGERTISALAFPTLSPWPAPGGENLQTRSARRAVQNVGIRWQLMSAHGSLSETSSFLDRGWRHHTNDYRYNAVNELAGLMGSIGEQLILAWSAEQDVQRWLRGRRDGYHRTMATRALAELSMHFSLGAAHGLANTVLRVLALDDSARTAIIATKSGANRPTYEPHSVDRRDWPTFSPTARVPWSALAAAAAGSGSIPAVHLVAELDRLRSDQRFIALDDRRGMDYHRHRPQSVLTSSPRGGVWTFTQQPGGVLTELSMAGAVLDAEQDEREVRRIAAGGLVVVAGTLGRTQSLIGRAVRSFGYSLHGCDWRPARTSSL